MFFFLAFSPYFFAFYCSCRTFLHPYRVALLLCYTESAPLIHTILCVRLKNYLLNNVHNFSIPRRGHQLAREGAVWSVYESPQSARRELSTSEALPTSGHAQAIPGPRRSRVTVLLLLGRLRLDVRGLKRNGATLFSSRLGVDLFWFFFVFRSHPVNIFFRRGTQFYFPLVSWEDVTGIMGRWHNFFHYHSRVFHHIFINNVAH